jgi:hypothetical protein
VLRAIGSVTVGDINLCNTAPYTPELIEVPGLYVLGDFQINLLQQSEPGRCGRVGKIYDIAGPGGSGLQGYAENWVTGPQFVVQYK